MHLLWSGGWDSTYRLLTLLLEHKVRTQPIYLIDPQRPSMPTELATMGAIRERLLREHPHVAELLLPRDLAVATDLPTNGAIDGWYAALVRARPTLGLQYHLVARYAAWCGIDDLELCVERHVGGIAYELMSSHTRLMKDPSTGLEYYKVRADHPVHGMELFQNVRFPVLGIDKLEMGRAAERAGFGAYMQMTWFCHRPLRGKPCGECGPCRDAADLGFRRRIPWFNRTVRRRVFRPLKRSQEQLLEFLRPRRRLRALFRAEGR